MMQAEANLASIRAASGVVGTEADLAAIANVLRG
jgi:hypothetical protein